MTITYNNFDQSSTGTGIELTCYYATDLARMLFRENFTSLDKDTYFYHNGDGMPGFTFKVEGSAEDMRLFLERESYRTYPDNLSDSDLPDYVIDVMEGESKINITNYMDKQADWLSRYSLNLVCNIQDINKVISRGHSQGDWLQIYFVGEKDSNALPFMHNLLWETPIRCCACVNGVEYDSAYNFDYEYDAEKISVDFEQQTGVSKDIFLKLLPQRPDYI